MAKYGDKNKYHLSSLERETIFSFNDRDDFATIYTSNTVMVRKLDKLCAEFPNEYKLKFEAAITLNADRRDGLNRKEKQ